MTSIRKLFVFDSICGLAGTLIYYGLFDFIVAKFSLPRDLVLTQLIANFSYTIYGIILYVSRTQNLKYFKFLMSINFIYAVLCMITSFILVGNKLYLGFALLLTEGLLIFFLALWEFKAIHLVNRQRLNAQHELIR